MDNINSDDLNEILSLLNQRLGMTTDRFDEFGNALDSETTAANRRSAAIAARAKKEEEALDKHLAKLGKSIDGLNKFGNSLSNAPGGFGPLNDIVSKTTDIVGNLAGSIPILGEAAKSLAHALGGIAQTLMQQFEKSYLTFEKMADTGIVASFTDMKEAAKTLGLTYDDLERVIGQQGKELAMFGKSALAGRNIFEQVGYESRIMRENFQKLGISSADFSEFQLSYIGQQQKYNRGQTKSVEELAAGSERYLINLDALSKLTGVSRKQLQADQEARLRDVRYRAGIAGLNKDVREEIDNLLSVVKSFAPGLEEGLKDMIAGKGVVSTPAAISTLLTLQTGGMDLSDTIRRLRDGTLKGVDAFNDMQVASEKSVKTTEELGSIKGTELTLTKNMADAYALADKKKMTQKDFVELSQLTKATIKSKGDENAAAADARQSMYTAAREFIYLTTSTEYAAIAISKLAGGVEEVVEKINEFTGKADTPYMKSRKKEREAEQELAKATLDLPGAGAAAKARAKYTGGMDAFSHDPIGYLKNPTAAVEEAEKRGVARAESQAKERVEAAKAAVEAAKKEREQLKEAETENKISEYLSFSGGDSGNLADFNKLTPEIRDKILAAAIEYKTATGRKLTINSAFRSSAKQKELWDATGGTGKMKDGTPVSAPGTSLHESGLAVDIQEGKAGDERAIKALMRQGLVQKIVGDPVHFSKMAKGGLVKPTPGGSLIQIAEAGQSEAVVPLPDGRSIPVDMKNSNNQSNLIISHYNATTKSYDAMSSKLDTMIALLGRSISIQNRMVNSLS